MLPSERDPIGFLSALWLGHIGREKRENICDVHLVRAAVTIIGHDVPPAKGASRQAYLHCGGSSLSGTSETVQQRWQIIVALI